MGNYHSHHCTFARNILQEQLPNCNITIKHRISNPFDEVVCVSYDNKLIQLIFLCGTMKLRIFEMRSKIHPIERTTTQHKIRVKNIKSNHITIELLQEYIDYICNFVRQPEPREVTLWLRNV